MLPCAALVFDMDGLMVDSEPEWYALQSDFVRARGAEWTAELARRCAGGGLANALLVMRGSLGLEVDIARDTAWMIDAFLGRLDRLRLKAGCLELVTAARAGGLPCAVGSSSVRRLVDATLARFDLRPCFGAVVTGECVARPKPAPDIFLEAAARLGVAPSGCVVLEDALAGVRAARAAGMRVIAVPEHGAAFAEAARTDDSPDAVVADLHEARAVLGL
jgi:beta-phosphoglucomutase-like phosphatase (HAD superfamily)